MEDDVFVAAVDAALKNEPIGNYRRVDEFRASVVKYKELGDQQ